MFIIFGPLAVVDCGNVPNVTNAIATLVDGDTQYGATVQYNCSIGYRPIGNSIITCPLNGSWPTPLTCTIVECGDPGIPVNGHSTGNNFTYGSTVTFTCDIGYELQGNKTALCQADGQWSSNIPLCLYIDFPDPCDTTTTSSDEPNNKETKTKGIMIGVTVGVSLFFVVLIIIIIILVSLFVWRSHHRTGKATVNSQNNGKQISVITNPLRKCLVNISLKLRYFNIIIILAWYPCIYSEYVLIMLSYKLF